MKAIVVRVKTIFEEIIEENVKIRMMKRPVRNAKCFLFNQTIFGEYFTVGIDINHDWGLSIILGNDSNSTDDNEASFMSGFASHTSSYYLT